LRKVREKEKLNGPKAGLFFEIRVYFAIVFALRAGVRFSKVKAKKDLLRFYGQILRTGGFDE
jgi:hypothetical protein